MASAGSDEPDDDNEPGKVRVEVVDVEGGGQVLIAVRRDGSPIDPMDLVAKIEGAEPTAYAALAAQWHDLSIGQLRRALTAWLREAGIEDAEHDSRRILETVLKPYQLNAVLDASTPAAWSIPSEVAEMAVRRAAREPLSQIIGSVGFWTLDLIVTRDVLTPRPDTETLVRAALGRITDRSAPLKILDIATGSGAIALALLSELPNAHAVATDISPAALEIAKANAARNQLSGRVRFLETGWADGVEGRFDLLVSNPPYIAPEVIATLEPEVRDFEPLLALDGGQGGLAPYPHLLNEARRLLNPGGHALFEIGHDQGAPVLELARAAGFGSARILADLAGHDRVLAVHN
ncbi:peptide chain release factor N(5)-glutamine methyltransferase [Glycocaulis sp.]|uniref:peptide chain release factor N(5)-glutamine methyltransferase n=1 Tax=Glycocaulis sp. TaxID=1969725 RepID=UPI003F71E2DC